MKCPVCSKELKELRVDDITVDICEHGCGGIWFDAFELQRVDGPDEPTGSKLVLAAEKIAAPSRPPDKDAKRQCPRCKSVKLKKHFFSPKRRVYVDQCPNCGGYWLDHGELQAIRAETYQKEAEQARPKEISMDMIRHLYRMRTEGRDVGPNPNQA